jgi:hypothetical protein
MRLRRLSALLTATVTTAALAAVAPVAASAAPAPEPGPAGVAAKPVSVTLITGDRVTTGANGALSIQRGPGRAGIRFVSRTTAGHRYVIPADALPLLRAGRLDQRLFDLTALRDFGYTGNADLPLLVAYPKAGNRKGAAGARAATGATARRGPGSGPR